MSFWCSAAAKHSTRRDTNVGWCNSVAVEAPSVVKAPCVCQMKGFTADVSYMQGEQKQRCRGRQFQPFPLEGSARGQEEEGI
mmetsp:Transcript_40083/g.82088  ORF Transcript_40083/g.82088 Transcript_40083/m.82088 type:complete len:82 (+) Transcript_40083:1545-1790(+)